MQRVWFITGASSGFGRALAEAVLRRGDGAVLAARRIAALEFVAAAYAQSALAVGLDVTDAEAREYLRFTLSFRDVEDLLAERGIVISYETVRRWVKPRRAGSFLD